MTTQTRRAVTAARAFAHNDRVVARVSYASAIGTVVGAGVAADLGNVPGMALFLLATAVLTVGGIKAEESVRSTAGQGGAS